MSRMGPRSSIALAGAGMAVLTCAAVLAAPAAARAETLGDFARVRARAFGYDPAASLAGPVLAGGSVVWGRLLPDGAWQIESGGARGPVRALALSTSAGGYHTVTQLAASASRVIWLDNGFDVINAHDNVIRTLRYQVRAVPLAGGRVRTALDCAAEPGCDPRSGVSAWLEGDTLAYALFGSFTEPATIALRPLSGGPAPAPGRIPAGSSVVAAAGARVAYVAGDFLHGTGMLVVYDAAAGREAYRLALPTAALPMASLQRSDGRLAAILAQLPSPAAPATGALRWFEPDGAPGGTLPLPRGRYVFALRFAGDRVAVLDGAQPYVTSTDLRLRVFDLNGRSRTIARFPAGDGTLDGGRWDFDGRTFAWAQTDRCGQTSLVRRSASARELTVSGRCESAIVAPSPLRADRSGRLAIPVRCPRGCRGTLTIRRQDPSGGSLLARVRVALRRGSRPGCVAGRLLDGGAVARASGPAEVVAVFRGSGLPATPRLTRIYQRPAARCAQAAPRRAR